MDDPHLAANDDRKRCACANMLMRRGDGFAIDARAAFKDQRLRLAPAFGEAREIEEFVKPQRGRP